MVFFRRWHLVLLALALSGGSLLAATREQVAYASAVAAFHDGFYPTAEAKLEQYLQTYRKSTNAPTAVLLLAESEFYMKNYPGAINRLADPVNLAKAKAAGMGDRYDYWRAEAQFAEGDPSSAAETFVSVANNYPKSPLALKAVVEASAAFGKVSNWRRVDDLLENTNGLFQRRASLYPTNEQVANGRLLQAESKCAQQDYPGAIRVLDLVNPAALAREQDWKRVLLLYRADMGGKNFAGALAAATNLAAIASLGHGEAWTTNLAESRACRAEVLEAQGQLAEAAEAWKENLGTNTPAEQQRRAILKVADLALAEARGNLRDAEARLAEFLTNYPASPASNVARLRLGELQLQEYIGQSAATDQLAQARSKLEEARGNLEEVINADPHGSLAGKAHLDHGWCNWLEATAAGAGDTNGAAAKFGESLADFKAAAGSLPRDSTDLAVACFKTGDAQFALGKFGDAINSYRAVLTDFPGVTNVAKLLGGRVLYQILRAQLELGDTNGMEDSMVQMLRNYAGSPQADNGLLLAGQGFSNLGEPAKARELFEQFARERTNSPLLPQVLFALARTYEQERNWPAMVTNCEGWLRSYPTNQSAPDVEYVRDLAVAQAGDEARAFQLFTNYVTRYPTNSALTPLAHWWLADHYFRLGDSVDAEYQYDLVFQGSDNPLAGQAELMAARAAMLRSSYKQAQENYLRPLLANTNAPEELRDKARFAWCEALRGLATETNTASRLEEATNILAEMYGETPTNIVGALAWCETGDCDLQLGALDAATNAYAQVLAAPSASVELRCRAQVGLGDVW
ncbi:MAG TPA: tetratricopeptide repeat protein, partial [Candidatus Acidoferrales bacterium]|nr:tetratricopeptide repeat protein [Candidatus Acidoferrales bacterium]